MGKKNNPGGNRNRAGALTKQHLSNTEFNPSEADGQAGLRGVAMAPPSHVELIRTRGDGQLQAFLRLSNGGEVLLPVFPGAGQSDRIVRKHAFAIAHRLGIEVRS